MAQSSRALAHPQSFSSAPERILAAAAMLFSELGYDAVSTTAIAERAGVSKANIFHHFSSKHSLYLEVLRTGCRESARRLDEIDEQKGSLEERLGNFIRAQLENLYKHETVSRLLFRELAESSPRRGQELAEQVFGVNFSRLVAMLREGQSQGELRYDIDPAMLATLLIGANVFFFQSRDVLRYFPEVSFADDRAGYSRMVTDILLQGVFISQRSAQQDARKS